MKPAEPPARMGSPTTLRDLTTMLPLTQLAEESGCGRKLSAVELRAALLAMDLEMPGGPKVVRGAYDADDAAVYRIDDDLLMVQTVDMFTPVVDDAVTWGAITATDALSDIYAMGARPVTALNIVGWPRSSISWDQMGAVLDGAAEVLRNCGCAMVGGHTIDSEEPLYGLSVTGFAQDGELLTNSGAEPGDQLVLTKPLGSGVITTAARLGHCPPGALEEAISWMTTTNAVAAQVAVASGVIAATDITGFGLVGHTEQFMRRSKTAAVLYASALPTMHGAPELLSPIPASAPMGPLLIDPSDADNGMPPRRAIMCSGSRRNLATSNFVDWNGIHESTRMLASDAQSSGGLLLSVPPDMLDLVIAEINARAEKHSVADRSGVQRAAWHIGEVIPPPKPIRQLGDPQTRIEIR